MEVRVFPLLHTTIKIPANAQHTKTRAQEGGFTLVGKQRKGGSRTTKSRAKLDAALSNPDRCDCHSHGDPDEAQFVALCHRVDEARADVRATAVFASLLRTLRALPPVDAIVCLGVGRFAESRAARYQLALTLLLRDELLLRPLSGDGGASEPSVHVYDPMLGALELRYAVEHAGCALRPENEAGRIHMAGLRCLYICIHCPRALYSNLLAANWGPERLSKVLVLSNSFAALADALDPAEAAAAASWCRVTRVTRRQPSLVTEVPLASGGELEHALSNTSLHSFVEESAMPPADDEVWTRRFEGAAPEPSSDGLLADGYRGK